MYTNVRWVQPESLLRDVRSGFADRQYLVARELITQGCERIGAAIKLADGTILREGCENGRQILYPVN